MKTSAFRGSGVAAAVLVVLLAAAPAPLSAQEARVGPTARIVTGGGVGDILGHPPMDGKACSECHGQGE